MHLLILPTNQKAKMVISHSKKFIFIHNYKVAGTSIRDVLDKYNDKTFLKSKPHINKLKFILGLYPKIYSRQHHNHSRALEIKNSIPAQVYDSYYKFGFVRNPWDWQVSLYTYALKNTAHYQHDLMKSFGNFDNYIDWRITKEKKLQKDFFYDGDECIVDFIGKMENLNEDFQTICSQIGIDASLPHLKKSRSDNKFRKFYTQKTIDLVYDAYLPDIETFNYQKPSL